MNHARLYDIMSGDDRSLSASASRLGLSVLEPGYRLAIALRNKQFDLGWRKPARLPRPVISVGNVTTGGTGKTPLVIELAKRLLEQGSHPAVLMRGYMPDQAGATSDEAQEIADELGSAVPVQPNPNRVEGAQRVLDKHPETTVFLLDDGFQHRQVYRDLDIVLIDATRPFGFDRLLPRGLLREPVGNVRRADAVIVTRGDLIARDVLTALDQRIETLTGNAPIAHAVSQWSGYRTGDEQQPEDHLNNLKVVGVCAIGNPDAFTKMLQDAAGEVLHLHAFDDHHDYSSDEIRGLLLDAGKRGADAVVITEKDWVKFKPLMGDDAMSQGAPPVLRPALKVGFLKGAQQVDQMLKSVVSPPR